MPVEMTLTGKVEALINDSMDVLVQNASAQPFDGDEHPLDAADWQLYYGIAVGLARRDEPCESLESVVGRAREAASQAFLTLNWDSPVATRARAELDAAKMEEAR